MQVIGGVIIGIAATLMLAYTGRVTGISGIIGSILNPSTSDKNWRLFFLTGLLLGGIVLNLLRPDFFTLISTADTSDYLIAGFLVGFGTLLGNGCTSGHGVCGISRFSFRSLVATGTFILAGALSVMVFRFLKGDL